MYPLIQGSFNIRNLVFVLICVSFAQCEERMTDIQTSTFLLQRLLEDDLEFIDDLNNYVAALEHHAKQVREYINELYSNHDPGDDLEKYVSNPLNAFGVIKRTSYDLINNLLTILNNQTWKELEEKLINDSSAKFPTMKDYYETCSSTALIQEAYNLSIPELIHGAFKVSA